MNQALIVKKPDRVKGIRPWCTKCKREIGNQKCGETGKKITSCASTEYHSYKAIVNVPGGGRSVKTRVLNTTKIEEAILLKVQFENELKSQSYQSMDVPVVKEVAKPLLLIECMSLYVGFLNNVGVERHMVRDRSKKYLDEVENHFTKFCKMLKHNHISHTSFRMSDIDDKVVSLFHTFILDELKHSNKTYNKMMGLMRRFTQWLIDKKGYELSNPFNLVQKRHEVADTTIMSEHEFRAILEAVDPVNSYLVLPSGERKNQYKPWLKHCYRLALETGLRREEYVSLRFSDVVTDNLGKPLFIKVENYKANRIRGGADISHGMKSIPITHGLLELLHELEFDEYKGTDRFILGPDEKASRETLMNFVSKSFTFFWKKTGIDREVQLKHLRNTYLTALVAHFGDKASIISDHSSMQVLVDNYVNNERLVSASKHFSIFS